MSSEKPRSLAALQQLSPEHRAVIELTFVEGFSYPQIASIVGCPENTVKTRMFHARRLAAQSYRISNWKAQELNRVTHFAADFLA